MKIAVDTHTHSTASIHAYSTIAELVRGARKRHLKGFVLSEHGPALQGMPHPYYFGNLRVLPPKIGGIFVFHGVELNIMDMQGGIDLSPKYLKMLDFVMAGFHEACFAPQTAEINTKAMIAAIENPLIDGISHPGHGIYHINIEKIVDAAKKNGKFLEINNSSFKVREGSSETCPEICRLCAQNGNLVSCGSDAHFWTDVGNFKTASAVIDSAGITPENVINSTLPRFLEYIKQRTTARRS
ncbi:MAG: phosphatase [Termitinemataceae bacterium]|nr:MAG: phosphatase [Termitinemataceae bacterium]